MGDVCLGSVSYLDGSRGITNKIRESMYKVASEFCYIGFLLHECQVNKYYLEHGYSSVYEYASVELGFKRTTVKNFISVNEVFGSRPAPDCGRTMCLQSSYEEFNFSQLVEMLSMSDSQRKLVTPDMTIKQIREIKKNVTPMTVINAPESELEQVELSLTGQMSDRLFSFDFTFDEVSFWVEFLDDDIRMMQSIDSDYCTCSEFLYLSSFLSRLRSLLDSAGADNNK